MEAKITKQAKKYEKQNTMAACNTCGGGSELVKETPRMISGH